MTRPAATADIGLIGLAVMGENLVLNMASHGFTVAVFNRTTSKVDAFLAGRAKEQPIIGTHTVQELVSSLKRPRKIMIMVKAGAAVDEVIGELVPLLQPGDILIDGGNSHFPDSTRRTRELKQKGILYIGTGVSGGEEGGAARTVDHAGRESRGLAPCEADLPGHRGQGGRRDALLRLGRPRRLGPLRQDGP